MLLPGGAYFKNANIPVLDIVQGTNFPVEQLGFAVSDLAFWKFVARGYTGGDLTVKVAWYSAATAGNVNLSAALAAYTAGTDTGSIEAKAFAAGTASEIATNANAKALSVTTLAITGAALDSLADEDVCELSLTRPAASGSEMADRALAYYVEVSWT